MSYVILDGGTVTDYVRGHPQAASLLDVTTPLGCAEIGDGNLNLVFRVFERGQSGRSVLVKQALPYVRAAGEGWPLGPQRAGFEARAQALQHRHAPGRVPRPYWSDPDLHLNAMEDLRHHEVIRRPLMRRVAYPGLGRTLGEFLAATLFGTSDFALDGPAKKELVAGFVNVELCELTEALIFSEPFQGGPNRNRYPSGLQADLAELQGDAVLQSQVAGLKYTFMTSAQALLHGDLHTGSVMASPPGPAGESDIRVIDPEFAFFGPMGFDLGLFLANLLLNAVSQHGHVPDAASRLAHREYLYAQARETWAAFETGMRDRFREASSASWAPPAFQDAFLLGVLRDAAGFAGCEMIRRTVGFAHVADLDEIGDEERRVGAGRLALRLGRTLILNHPSLARFEEFERLARNLLDVPEVHP